MTETNTKDRIAFLAEKFDVFEESNQEEKVKTLEADGFKSVKIEVNNTLLAFASYKKKGETKYDITKISVSLGTFSKIIAADPTPNKSCVQWMLNVFTRLALGDHEQHIDHGAAIRFVTEDLPQANEYITLFEANKRKNKFKSLCESSYILKNVKNPTDINQFRSLSQLYDAIDPFIVREPGTLESLLLRYVQAGEAEIPVKDRKFTLYIPLSLNASTVFGEYAGWCTARAGNSQFAGYTSYKTSLKTNSKLYIIINNGFFEGHSQELYQIHFESNQVKDRRNSYNNVNIYEGVLSQSEALSNFFYEELMKFAKAYKNSNGQHIIETNPYLTHLINFGFTESLFELMEAETPTIRIMKREIPRLPDMSRFKNLDQLTITDANLVDIHESIGKLTELTMVCLSNNKIKSLPASIGNLKNVGYMNLANNPLVDIPEEIKYLDSSRGGSLFRLTVTESEIGKDNLKRLRMLLPNAIIS